MVELALEAGGETYRMGDEAGMPGSPGKQSARATGCTRKAQTVVMRSGRVLARADVTDGTAELEVESPVRATPPSMYGSQAEKIARQDARL